MITHHETYRHADETFYIHVTVDKVGRWYQVNYTIHTPHIRYCLKPKHYFYEVMQSQKAYGGLWAGSEHHALEQGHLNAKHRIHRWQAWKRKKVAIRIAANHEVESKLFVRSTKLFSAPDELDNLIAKSNGNRTHDNKPVSRDDVPERERDLHGETVTLTKVVFENWGYKKAWRGTVQVTDEKGIAHERGIWLFAEHAAMITDAGYQPLVESGEQHVHIDVVIEYNLRYKEMRITSVHKTTGKANAA